MQTTIGVTTTGMIGEGVIVAPMRVLVADAHPLFREGFARALEHRPELAIVGLCADGDELMRRVAELEPDVLVVDAALPGLDAPRLPLTLAAAGHRTRVMLLSAHVEGADVYRTLGAGVAAILTKAAGPDAIVSALRAVVRGQIVLAPQAQTSMASEIRLRRDHRRPALTGREREVIALVARDHTTGQVARSLHLSSATVKTHLQNAYEKLGVSDRAAAVAVAMRHGLLE